MNQFYIILAPIHELLFRNLAKKQKTKKCLNSPLGTSHFDLFTLLNPENTRPKSSLGLFLFLNGSIIWQ